MENILYNIKDNNNNDNEIDIESLVKEIDEQHLKIINNKCSSDMRTDTSIALELEYNTNYNVKDLGKILDYYEISKRKLRKDEMIQLLIFFEEDPSNVEFVNRRRRLWENIKELKEDKYFSKYILF